MALKIEFVQSKQLRTKYKSYIASVGHYLGLGMQRELLNEVYSIVEEFYKEYKPHSYKRHKDRGFEKSGYQMAIHTRFVSPGGYKDTRRINIEVGWTTDNMYDDYGFDPERSSYSEASAQEAVLRSFIEGYHGDPNFDIPTHSYPKRLYEYLDRMLSPEGIDLLKSAAVQKANQRGIF